MSRLKAAVERLRYADSTVTLGSVHIEMGYIFPTTPASWLRPDVSLTHPRPANRSILRGRPVDRFRSSLGVRYRPQLDAKVSEYLANGAAEVRLLYPNRRHAWVFDGSAAARHETRSIHSPLLPGIEIPLSEIF